MSVINLATCRDGLLNLVALVNSRYIFHPRPQIATQFLPLAFALYRASSAFVKRSSILLLSSVSPQIAATPMLTVK